MERTETDKERMLDEAVAHIEKNGGVARMRAELKEYWGVWEQMQKQIKSLTEKHPDKWIAMSKEGIIAIGDDIEEVLAVVDDRGISRNVVVTEFMDTGPDHTLSVTVKT